MPVRSNNNRLSFDTSITGACKPTSIVREDCGSIASEVCSPGGFDHFRFCIYHSLPPIFAILVNHSQKRESVM